MIMLCTPTSMVNYWNFFPQLRILVDYSIILETLEMLSTYMDTYTEILCEVQKIIYKSKKKLLF